MSQECVKFKYGDSVLVSCDFYGLREGTVEAFYVTDGFWPFEKKTNRYRVKFYEPFSNEWFDEKDLIKGKLK